MLDDVITLQEAVENDLLFEMVNIKARRTGLPYDLWIDSDGKQRTNKHNAPRVKVNVDGNLIPIVIGETTDVPSNLKGISDFKHKTIVLKYIQAYKNILLAHFNNQIDDKDAVNLLGPLTKSNEANKNLEGLLITTPQCVATFNYNTDELLYEIELTDEHDNLLAVAYVIHLHEVISKIAEWQEEFNIVKIIDKDNLLPETKL